MPSRWLRIAIALATTLAAWLVVAPAHAAAPQCDGRGAITFAPAPQLQAPETSIDLGVSAHDDCAGLGSDGGHALDEGRAPAPAPAPLGLEATLPGRLVVSAASSSALAPHGRDVVRAPAGVRGRVDRPPRA